MQLLIRQLTEHTLFQHDHELCSVNAWDISHSLPSLLEDDGTSQLCICRSEDSWILAKGLKTTLIPRPAYFFSLFGLNEQSINVLQSVLWLDSRFTLWKFTTGLPSALHEHFTPRQAFVCLCNSCDVWAEVVFQNDFTL